VTAQGEDMNFSWEETSEMQRRLNILWNVARFPLPYMRADGFDPESVALKAQSASGRSSGQSLREEAADETVADDLELVDEWILSRLQSVEAAMTRHMDDFENDKAVEELLEFVVEDVSRFYIQVVRERMWEESDSASKQAAYATLYRVLEEVAALFAPFTPFVAEEIYDALTGDAGHPTVHMCDWPEADEDLRDEQLEREIEIVREVEQAGSAARQQAERKLRWPIARAVVSAPSEEIVEAVDAQRELLKDRLNARAVEIVGPEADWEELGYSAEADMSELGPAFGDDAGRVMNALNESRVESWDLALLEGAVEDATGLDADLEESMVEPVQELPEGVSNAEFTVNDEDDQQESGRVYVDTSLTDDIESEGYAREVIRRVQEMRKDLELDIQAGIRLSLDVQDDRIADLVREHEDLIAQEVRGEFSEVEDGHRKEWEVEGVTMEIAIQEVAEATA